MGIVNKIIFRCHIDRKWKRKNGWSLDSITILLNSNHPTGMHALRPFHLPFHLMIYSTKSLRTHLPTPKMHYTFIVIFIFITCFWRNSFEMWKCKTHWIFNLFFNISYCCNYLINPHNDFSHKYIQWHFLKVSRKFFQF